MIFFDMVKDGGPVMWVIMACAVLVLAVFLAKVFQFHRDEINVRELLRGLINVLQRDGLVEALTLCDSTPGPAARLLSAAILAYQRGDSDGEIRQAVDEAALDELPKLERGVGAIGSIGFVLPLMGFLGTVLGMLDAFKMIEGSGNVSTAAVKAIPALITTAAALVVAIPCYLGHNYLVSRINAITVDMEKAALEITSFFSAKRSRADEPRREK